MRTSNLLLATVKETPSDAEIISHQLMLRAGMIRKLAAGLYTWLPLGLRVLRKVENIIRDEMNNAGVDFQFIAYGEAVHSFTNPNSGNDPSRGVAYNATADRRSWQHMQMFFGEIFK